MAHKEKPFYVEWDPVTDPDAEDAVRDVFKLVLRQIERKAVDNED